MQLTFNQFFFSAAAIIIIIFLFLGEMGEEACIFTVFFFFGDAFFICLETPPFILLLFKFTLLFSIIINFFSHFFCVGFFFIFYPSACFFYIIFLFDIYSASNLSYSRPKINKYKCIYSYVAIKFKKKCTTVVAFLCNYIFFLEQHFFYFCVQITSAKHHIIVYICLLYMYKFMIIVCINV